ncbi:MAG TPA: pseudouridine-5'-phosphate glycosidase [Lacibacter sp.]|nr:pseudouridine-5'-phosphate glycosidase [Lacibacter sp.]HMO90056.1 pseudouridine-5'-phosphate glycosidase [Lacibacter sp.]HMP85814.1 pseudouridine-5'-phosphate glycosidase [Lacibacter sp.]
MNPLLQIAPDVQQALQQGQPVVALESTIISHGMPWPQNVETALAVEAEVRAQGAVPATIAVMNGACRVGLSAGELAYFGQARDVWKVSLRDLPYVVSRGLNGATTVAATMRIASLAGIRVFVTGGIGGVHRGGERSMDVSADLTEMAQTSVAVVSAGVKSILDIGRTLEYLETLGVPVVTVGQDAFPSFYSQNSGYTSPLRLDGVEELARLLQAKWQLGLNGSVLIANPVPEEQALPAAAMEAEILIALEAADLAGVTGKAVTPFLLQHIAEHTRGESLETNIALIRHNARLGGQLAVAYAAVTVNRPGIAG